MSWITYDINTTGIVDYSESEPTVSSPLAKYEIDFDFHDLNSLWKYGFNGIDINIHNTVYVKYDSNNTILEVSATNFELGKRESEAMVSYNFIVSQPKYLFKYLEGAVIPQDDKDINKHLTGYESDYYSESHSIKDLSVHGKADINGDLTVKSINGFAPSNYRQIIEAHSSDGNTTYISQTINVDPFNFNFNFHVNTGSYFSTETDQYNGDALNIFNTLEDDFFDRSEIQIVSPSVAIVKKKGRITIKAKSGFVQVSGNNRVTVVLAIRINREVLNRSIDYDYIRNTSNGGDTSSCRTGVSCSVKENSTIEIVGFIHKKTGSIVVSDIVGTGNISIFKH